MRRSALDRFIQGIAIDAGTSIRNNYGKVKSGEVKSTPKDIVTKADYEAEDIIISAIRKKYPYHAILSEEAGELSGKSDYTWIIDPLDGTANFANQVPLFCVIIALAKGNTVEAGVMYDPIHDQLLYARKGQGAYMNNKPISVSDEDDLSEMVIQVSNVRGRSSHEQFAHMRSVVALYTTYYKAFGSAGITLSMVASGRVDSYIIAGAYPWDIAAGARIIKEAGGKITTLEGKRWSWRTNNQQIITANPKLHKKIHNLVSQT